MEDSVTEIVDTVMRSLRLFVLGLVGLLEISTSRATPPVNVGDSFLAAYAVTPMGHEYFYMYYLGADGTCTQLSATPISTANAPVAPETNPSLSGTYTYAPVSGNPKEATLTFNFGGTPVVYTLSFVTDTTGGAIASSFLQSNVAFYFYLPIANTFLANVSNRVTLHPGDTAITGFVITGGNNHLVLIRAVGPTLAQFGVNPVSSNPTFNFYMGTGSDLIAPGQPWGSFTGYDAPALNQIFRIAGAFALQAGSSDQAYFGPLNVGAYTVQTSDATVPSGGASVLTEVYILPYSD
jgi:hypothetical protein